MTGVIFLSLKVAFAAMIVSLPLALAMAVVLTRLRFRGQFVLRIMVYMPLVLPPVVTGYMLLLALGPASPVGRLLAPLFAPLFGGGPAFHWTGAAIAAGVMAFPLMVRPMALALDSIDRRLEESAATLGASRLRVFMTITFPMAMPGILAGLALGFAKALGEFGATITFAANIPGQTQTLALAVHSALQRADGDATALFLTGIAIAIGAVAVGLSEFAGTRIVRASRA